MKKLIILSILMAMFFSVCGCGFVTDIWQDDDERLKYFDPNLADIATDAESLSNWVNDNTRGVSDSTKWGIPEYWQHPQLTMEDGTGDCEDHVILFMYLMYYYFDVKCSLLAMDYWGDGLHAVSYYDGYYYDPTLMYDKQSGEDWIIIDSISFDTVMMYVRGASILADTPSPYILDW